MTIMEVITSSWRDENKDMLMNGGQNAGAERQGQDTTSPLRGAKAEILPVGEMGVKVQVSSFRG